MWFMYPMKPVRVSMQSVGAHPLDRYILEKKYDGHRAILIVDRGQKKLFTRQRVPIAISPDLASQLDPMEMKEGTVLDAVPLSHGTILTNMVEVAVNMVCDVLITMSFIPSSPCVVLPLLFIAVSLPSHFPRR